MEPLIRAAEPRDARLVSSIYVDSWNDGFVGLLPPRRHTEELAARWEQDLCASYPQRWWVGEVDGTVVGFVGIGPSRDPIDPALGELDTIAVQPRRWRTGVGRVLMAVAVEHLSADGYREAILWTPTDYERGQAFYEATGWKLDGGVRDEGRQVRYRRQLAHPSA